MMTRADHLILALAVSLTKTPFKDITLYDKASGDRNAAVLVTSG